MYYVLLSDGQFEDGTLSVSRECGHKHRSLEAAHRCRCKLRESANWHSARVVEVGKDRLSSEDEYKLSML